MRTYVSLDELTAAEGQHLGYSEWQTVTQPMIDAFAAATGDEQWIHVDPVRARSGPFGTTIAHGFLTLSLIAVFSREIYSFGDSAVIVNYGADSVRFPAPVPVDTAVRAGAELRKVDVGPHGARVTVRFIGEAQHVEKPVLVADSIFLVQFADDGAAL